MQRITWFLTLDIYISNLIDGKQMITARWLQSVFDKNFTPNTPLSEARVDIRPQYNNTLTCAGKNVQEEATYFYPHPAWRLEKSK